jgi:ABC-2 type transport system ATP-binding protein
MTSPHSTHGGIVLEQLTKSYGDVRAVREIDLLLAAGETVALLGPNGAGKSTTIDMILGLTRPDGGSVALFGMTPAEAVTAGIVGGMLQTGSLIPYLQVRELVTMVASLYPRALPVDHVLDLTGSAAFADQATNALSGGQTQRVRFAIALVANPDLLVLDEPTAALDVEGRRDFWAAMRKVASQGTTVIFATHYLEEADQFADRIVLMAQGRIVADGASTEIKSMVHRRTIRLTLPGAAQTELSELPAVTAVERRGDSWILTSSDSDTSVRALLQSYPAAHDIEVQGAALEEAFLALTADTGTNADTDTNADTAKEGLTQS